MYLLMPIRVSCFQGAGVASRAAGMSKQSMRRNQTEWGIQSYPLSFPIPSSQGVLSTNASSLAVGDTHLLLFHGFTLLIYVVSTFSNGLPCVSQTKKYTINTAAKQHPANTYPCLNPISETINSVKNAMRKFHIQFENVTNAMLRAR